MSQHLILYKEFVYSNIPRCLIYNYFFLLTIDKLQTNLPYQIFFSLNSDFFTRRHTLRFEYLSYLKDSCKVYLCLLSRVCKGSIVHHLYLTVCQWQCHTLNSRFPLLLNEALCLVSFSQKPNKIKFISCYLPSIWNHFCKSRLIMSQVLAPFSLPNSFSKETM